jgi:monoamine oxidase
MQKTQDYDADVLVIGAGVAGLAAARDLVSHGVSVIVLEAQDRIGGRILTQRIGEETIELGAEFVHGRPPQLLALIEEAGLELVERSGSFIRIRDGVLVVDENGKDNDQSQECGRVDADPSTLLEQLEDRSGPDVSFAEFLEQKPLSEEDRDAVIGYVEGFNAADYCVASVAALGLQQKAEDAIEGDRIFHVAGGYDQVPAFLAARVEADGGRIRLATRVHRLEWQPGSTAALTSQGAFTARRAIITVPLGVLQSGGIEFQPPLPQPIRAILTSDGPIRMGDANRFTLLFRERFWRDLPPQPALSELSFLLTPGAVPAVWWTPHPEQSNALTGWVGGPRASTLASLSTEALVGRACEALATLFQLDAAYVRSLLIGCHTHNWLADPNSLGTYSYIAKDGLDAPARLQEPLAYTLYFAGEHTTIDGHWGTVHAALSTGLAAAAKVISTTSD